jgi:DNA ligase-1
MPQLPFKPQNANKAADVAEAAAKCESPMLEPKYDGWRMIVIIDAEGEPRLFSRKGLSYTRQTPEPILTELRRFPPNTILDGEVVDSIDNKNCTAVTNVFGKSTTPALQMEKDRINYIVFDCIEIDGHKIAADGDSLASRRQMFDTYSQGPLHPSKLKRIALTPQAPAEQEYHNLFLELGYEGTMIKDNAAPYAFGKRGKGWFKIKATVEIDVIIMGMELDGKGQHEGKVGRFIVGQYQLGELCQRAKVNPYDDAMRNAMTADRELVEVGGGRAIHPGGRALYTSIFIGKVCTIKHYGVLKDGLRHPTFVKWREDKPAEECEYDNG